jgi:hypothetical protein
MQSPGSTIARVYSAEDRASARRLGLLLQCERGEVSRRQLEPSQIVVRNARSHAQLRSHGCPSAQAMERSGAAGGLWPAPPLASFVPAASTRASVPAPWTTLPEVVQGSHPAEDLPGGGANRQGCTTAGFCISAPPLGAGSRAGTRVLSSCPNLGALALSIRQVHDPRLCSRVRGAVPTGLPAPPSLLLHSSSSGYVGPRIRWLLLAPSGHDFAAAARGVEQ